MPLELMENNITGNRNDCNMHVCNLSKLGQNNNSDWMGFSLTPGGFI